MARRFQLGSIKAIQRITRRVGPELSQYRGTGSTRLLATLAAQPVHQVTSSQLPGADYPCFYGFSPGACSGCTPHPPPAASARWHSSDQALAVDHEPEGVGVQARHRTVEGAEGESSALSEPIRLPRAARKAWVSASAGQCRCVSQCAETDRRRPALPAAADTAIAAKPTRRA